MEAAVISGEKSELADVLERVCSEKEASEREAARLQRRVNHLMCENDRLKDQVAALQENLRVCFDFTMEKSCALVLKIINRDLKEFLFIFF